MNQEQFEYYSLSLQLWMSTIIAKNDPRAIKAISFIVG